METTEQRRQRISGAVSAMAEEKERRAAIAALQANDRNGIYTDSDAEAEGYAPLTLEQARALMAEQGLV